MITPELVTEVYVLFDKRLGGKILKLSRTIRAQQIVGDGSGLK